MVRSFDSSIGRAVDVMLDNLAATLTQDINDPAADTAGIEAEEGDD
jgi:hypothetical protein